MPQQHHQQQPEWPGFPGQCRAHHPWRPGTVRISWEPCDCPPAREFRGGHITIECGAPGCREVWQRPRHEVFRLPKILGHEGPGH